MFKVKDLARKIAASGVRLSVFKELELRRDSRFARVLCDSLAESRK
jgi:hypothetical protein